MRWSLLTCFALGLLATSAEVRSQVPAAAQAPAVAQPPAVEQPAAESPDAQMAEGRRLFDAFDYEKSVPIFDRVIATAPAATKADLLVQAYELRARAKFALGDSAGAENDFTSLLALRPAFALGASISPRVVAIFDGVKKKTIGQLMLSLTPISTVMIDGQAFTPEQIAQPLDLVVGSHTIEINRPGYRPVNEKFTITAATRTPLTISSERISATISVATVPEGVEIVVDGMPRGVTAGGDGLSENSARLILADLQPGSHRILFRKPCFSSHERQVNIEQPDDFELDPVRLTSAVATATIETTDTETTIYMDGKAQGPAPGRLEAVCEGRHTIEVRSPRGRFVDRREWRAGDSATIKAELKPAFALIPGALTETGAAAAQVLASVEQALSRAPHLMFFAPTAADLAMAMQEDNVQAGWLKPDPDDAPPAAAALDARRDVAAKLASRLDTQGFVAVSNGSDAEQLILTILAAGSRQPEQLSLVQSADTATQAQALNALTSPTPRLLKPSLQISVVDLAGVPGAAVIQVGGAGAKAGLAAGDLITSAGGAPVTSVAQLRDQIGTLDAATAVPLEVTGLTGASKTVSVTPVIVPDALPLQDPALLYNRLLLEMQQAVHAGGPQLQQDVARLNLAIVSMRLNNWEEALRQLRAVKLADGPGVSSGTVAYLTGVCLDATGKPAEAQAEYRKAAAAAQSRLSDDGPLIPTLVQHKLRR